jgi:transcriptional antiterminator NusG
MILESANFIKTRRSPLDWYAVRVRSNYERVVAAGLRSKGFDICLPLCRPKPSSAKKNKDIALFRGYVFCCFDASIPLQIVTVPGVVGIVCCGRTPEPVDAMEMLAVQKLADSGVVSEPYPYIQVGQRVCLREGPLEGVEGLLLRERGTERLVISVSLLQRSIVAEVERRWVEPSVVSARPAA